MNRAWKVAFTLFTLLVLYSVAGMAVRLSENQAKFYKLDASRAERATESRP